MLMKRLTCLLPIIILAACASGPVDDDRLYARLGERDNIGQFVQETLLLSIEDERIAHHFEGVNMFELQRLLTDQICEVAGGPCEYDGRDMAETHAGLAITRTEFNILLEHLLDAMTLHDVPVPAQNRLTARLAPMHEEIVGQ